MTRRLQLLHSEDLPLTRRVLAGIGRVRDSLLRDNKVVPPVLAVLALLIFAWLLAGALMGSPGDQKQEEQISSQASLAQTPKDSENGGSKKTPAPGVENRDADSYAGYDQPRDPFRNILEKSGGGKGKAGDSKDKTGDSQDKASDSKDKTGDSKDKTNDSKDKTGDSKAGEGKSSDSKAKTDDSRAKTGEGKNKVGDNKGKAGNGKANASGSGDLVDQSSPGDEDLPGGGPGGSSPDQGGSGGLFNSGGDLPAP